MKTVTDVSDGFLQHLISIILGEVVIPLVFIASSSSIFKLFKSLTLSLPVKGFSY